MDKTKRLYASTTIINASLDDQQIEAEINKIQDLIAKNGGEILAVERMGRKRLAYVISKKNNGFYVNIEFRATGNLIPLLERSYQLNETILRYLTTQVSKKALKARQQPMPAREEPILAKADEKIGLLEDEEDELDDEVT